VGIGAARILNEGMNEIDHSARQAAREFSVELRELLGGRLNQH
jgi:hypothetical protein